MLCMYNSNNKNPNETQDILYEVYFSNPNTTILHINNFYVCNLRKYSTYNILICLTQ